MEAVFGTLSALGILSKKKIIIHMAKCIHPKILGSFLSACRFICTDNWRALRHFQPTASLLSTSFCHNEVFRYFVPCNIPFQKNTLAKRPHRFLEASKVIKRFILLFHQIIVYLQVHVSVFRDKAASVLF